MEFKLAPSVDTGASVKVNYLIIIEYETRISIMYDHKSRTVSFYKNSILQGNAFRNVPAGLTPSLDIWFESGTVEIMKNTGVQDKIFL
jgi:Iap family predicted aminopeptidase